jgi:tetratricopeptide (TPR) repeat protein
MMPDSLVPLAIVIALVASDSRSSAQGSTPSTATQAAPAQAPPAKAPAPSSGDAAFQALVKQATAARQANDLDAAIRLYNQALKANPRWAEGYWYLGTSYYEQDRYDEARAAFARVTKLTPDNGDAWALKGLCEFQLKNYDTALSDLIHGRDLGGGSANKELVSVSRYHLGILLTRTEQFEQALQLLNGYAVEGDDSPKVIEAMGLATLRMPILPAEMPGATRAQVMLAGRANYFMAARLPSAAEAAFQELAARYPETPNVHYAYGLFLVGEKPDNAIEQFKAELKVSPRHPWSKLQLATEYIRRQDWDSARPWAEQAVAEAPNLFVAHRALGQVLLETGDVDGAIREFETGVQQAPDSPAMRFVLARAYRRAGRIADADREQAEFARLDRILRMQRTGSESVGGIDGGAKPPQ